MNSPSYYSCKCSQTSSPCSKICPDYFESNCLNKEKDILISQLKAHIFELELHEKDYNLLNERYCQLQQDFAILNDCKLKLECEIKLKDEEFSKNIYDLQGENENLQLNLNEKLSSNKNMFAENNSLNKECELKDIEICNLKERLNDLNCQLYRNREDRNNLQNTINGINDIRESQKIKICQLLEDNKTLKEIVAEQDGCINSSNMDKVQMEKELEEKNNCIKDLNCRISMNITNEENLKNKLNSCNVLNLSLEKNIKDYETQLNCLKYENNNLKSNLIAEKSLRIEENQKNKKLCNVLGNCNNKMNSLLQENELIKRQQENESEKNCVLQEENSKLRKHIMILSDLNQNLMNEIDNVINEDAKMRCILDRKERINSLLMNNRCTLDQSLNCLSKCVNKRNCLNQINPCPMPYHCH